MMHSGGTKIELKNLLSLELSITVQRCIFGIVKFYQIWLIYVLKGEQNYFELLGRSA